MLPAFLCLLFAVLMQIDANLFNDWWDCRKGVDTTVPRIGPLRVCAAGLISMKSMLRAIIVVTMLSTTVGLAILLWSAQLTADMPFGIPAPSLMLATGICCLIGFAAYSTFFSRWAMGDILVIVFFGLIPVLCTYLLQDISVNTSHSVLRHSLGMGLAADTLLMVNNYRDRHGDATVGKHTICTIIGGQASELLYLILGILAVVISTDWTNTAPTHIYANLLLLPYLSLHIYTYRRMIAIREGAALNRVLGATARNIFILGLCLSAMLLLA